MLHNLKLVFTNAIMITVAFRYCSYASVDKACNVFLNTFL